MIQSLKRLSHLFIYFCVIMHICVDTCTMRSEGYLQELVFIYHHVGSRLGRKCLYLLSHLMALNFFPFVLEGCEGAEDHI